MTSNCELKHVLCHIKPISPFLHNPVSILLRTTDTRYDDRKGVRSAIDRKKAARLLSFSQEGFASKIINTLAWTFK